jgi:type IV secretory pathway VirB2 component (pilin)
MKRLSPEMLSAVQEFLRTLVLGEIFTFLAVITIIAAGINRELGTFVIEWNVALAVFVADTLVNLKTSIASAVDKYMHKSGVKTVLDFKGLDTFK